MIKLIEKIVCEKECVCKEAIHTKSRKRELVLARQIIMYFTRKIDKSASLKQVGSYFNKDHATTVHACKTISNLIDSDRIFKSLMRYYEIRLNGIKVIPELSLTDTLETLKDEVLRIETTISDLRDRAKLLKAEIKCISIHRAKLLRDELKLLSVKTSKVKIEVKPVIKIIKPVIPISNSISHQFISPYAGMVSCNDREMQYREPSL